MSRREFHLVEGTAKKFWAVQVDGATFTVHYGRIGTTGQAQQKSFADEATAKREADKLIHEKTKKGYVEAAAGATGAAGPAPAAKAAAPAEQKAAPAAPAPMLTPAAAETPGKSPSIQAASEIPAAATPGAASGPLERSIKLSAADRHFVTWEEHPTLPKPASAPFDLEDCRSRLRAVGEIATFWKQDWSKAKVPEFPSREEAQFWLLAFGECRAGKTSPVAMAEKMASVKLDGVLSLDQTMAIGQNTWRAPVNLFSCVAVLISPNDFVTVDWSGRHTAGSLLADGFRTAVLPYLTVEERRELREEAARRITVMTPASSYHSWPSYYYVGAMLGCHEELLALTRSVPDGAYRDDKQGFHIDYYQTPQWLVFGLGDAQTVASEFRRIGVTLRTREQARAWLALTGLTALDVLVDSTCRASSKEDAAKVAGALVLVTAPEAATPALQIALESKAPQIGREWLNTRLLHAVAGLTPTAVGQGKLAEGAREFLRTTRRGGHLEILTAALAHLPAEPAAWLQREIIDAAEEALADIPRDDLPEPLRAVLAEVKAAKPPAWLTIAALPPLKVLGRKLALPEVETIVTALKATPVGAASALFAALREHADANSRDTFAWKLFDTWLGLGAPSKEKWTMGGIGHLGGDGCVLKLTPLVREWPGESQHQRAVFGLECLRAVGTDTALMALNGIAQKLKFKTLKEKAQALMEGIAESRGLTHEELADRIVPDCELDERGGRVFDFGPRQFHFVLGTEMKPLIRDAAGKVRPDLPAPNSSDDAEKAEAAVADWKLLKKTLREVLKVQAVRLEDAMISGRRWKPEEFQTLLVKHPLMINLVRQLVFAVYDDGGRVVSSFRVTEDQSLADEHDEAAELPAAGRIGVAHPAHFSEELKGAWGQVLSDYEIIPPFQQLGRAICRPEPEDLEATAITRYRGPKIPGMVMYGMLERSQWLRDTPADGGGFTQHSKHFPAANVTAFIEYDGMAIGYYEEKQELQSVYFVPGHVKPDWWGKHEKRVKVKDVDPVVMSEVLRLANAIVAKAE